VKPLKHKEEAVTILTTSIKEGEDEEDILKIKSLFMKKALIVKLNDIEFRQKTMIELISHLFYSVKNYNDKFLILYAFFKLGIVVGKTLVSVNSLDVGYNLKLFLDRFQVKAHILNPEYTKNYTKSLIGFFNGGQYDILIIVAGRSILTGDKIAFKNVVNVINFEFPLDNKSYIHNSEYIQYEKGSIFSLITQGEETRFSKIEHRQMKKYGRMLMNELPLKFEEIDRFRYRCDDVLRSVTKHNIKTARLNDVKKQLMSSQKLKDYFEAHPNEKDVLGNINSTDKNALMHKHLGQIPHYLIPESIISNPIEEKLQSTKLNVKCVLGKRKAASVPANSQTTSSVKDHFAYEDPNFVTVEQLEPTSGRKLWKMKHRKTINKKLKRYKDGFQGGN